MVYELSVSVYSKIPAKKRGEVPIVKIIIVFQIVIGIANSIGLTFLSLPIFRQALSL